MRLRQVGRPHFFECRGWFHARALGVADADGLIRLTPFLLVDKGFEALLCGWWQVYHGHGGGCAGVLVIQIIGCPPLHNER